MENLNVALGITQDTSLFLDIFRADSRLGIESTHHNVFSCLIRENDKIIAEPIAPRFGMFKNIPIDSTVEHSSAYAWLGDSDYDSQGFAVATILHQHQNLDNLKKLEPLNSSSGKCYGRFIHDDCVVFAYVYTCYSVKNEFLYGYVMVDDNTLYVLQREDMTAETYIYRCPHKQEKTKVEKRRRHDADNLHWKECLTWLSDELSDSIEVLEKEEEENMDETTESTVRPNRHEPLFVKEEMYPAYASAKMLASAFIREIEFNEFDPSARRGHIWDSDYAIDESQMRILINAVWSEECNKMPLMEAADYARAKIIELVFRSLGEKVNFVSSEDGNRRRRARERAF